MARLAMIAAGALLLLGAAPDSAAVARLEWMSGSWVSEQGERWTEESWTFPRGGMMLGAGSSGRGATVRDWEHMRIAPDEAGVLSFWGSPKGAPPVAFRLVSLGRTEAVFENSKHDFPQRIAYRREGKALVATISLADGSKPTSWRYRRRVP
jgi:Domain of unknown function (DUF6265)